MRNYQAARGMHTAFLLDCKSMAERPAYKDISREQMPGNAGALRVSDLSLQERKERSFRGPSSGVTRHSDGRVRALIRRVNS